MHTNTHICAYCVRYELCCKQTNIEMNTCEGEMETNTEGEREIEGNRKK